MSHKCPLCKGELFPNTLSNFWFCDKDHVFTDKELQEWDYSRFIFPVVAEGGEGHRGSAKPKKPKSLAGTCTCGSGQPKTSDAHSHWCDIKVKPPVEDEYGYIDFDLPDLFEEDTEVIDPKKKP